MENKNVRNARRYARHTNGKLEKWKGQNGKTWASSTSAYESENIGVALISKVFPGNENNDHNGFWNFMSAIDIPDGHADPCNTGTITKEDAQVGGAIIGTIVSGGALIETVGGIELTIGIASTLNSADGITTNKDGSIVTGLVENKGAKKLVKGAKQIISAASMGASGYKVPDKIQNIIPFANDASSNIQHAVEKIQEVDEKK